jgi:hypothetical protein
VCVILPLEGEGWAPVAEGDWGDGVTNLEGGDSRPLAHADQPENYEATALLVQANSG